MKIKIETSPRGRALIVLVSTLAIIFVPYLSSLCMLHYDPTMILLPLLVKWFIGFAMDLIVFVLAFGIGALIIRLTEYITEG